MWITRSHKPTYVTVVFWLPLITLMCIYFYRKNPPTLVVPVQKHNKGTYDHNPTQDLESFKKIRSSETCRSRDFRSPVFVNGYPLIRGNDTCSFFHRSLSLRRHVFRSVDVGTPGRIPQRTSVRAR